MPMPNLDLVEMKTNDSVVYSGKVAKVFVEGEEGLEGFLWSVTFWLITYLSTN